MHFRHSMKSLPVTFEKLKKNEGAEAESKGKSTRIPSANDFGFSTGPKQNPRFRTKIAFRL